MELYDLDESDEVARGHYARRSPESSHSLENVTQENLGLSSHVVQRGRELVDFCRMVYDNNEQSVYDDSEKFLKRLGETHPGWQMECISVNKQNAAIFYNDEEIVVSFDGSIATEPRHYYRNLVQSRVANKDYVYKPEITDRSILENDTTLERLSAKLAQQHGTPEEAETIKHNILHADVHGGWSGVLSHPVQKTYPPGLVPEGTEFWDAIHARMDALTSSQPQRKTTFAGHSSGGAIASIAAARWMLSRDTPVEGIYTFGQPRTGGPEFRDALHTLLGGANPAYYRFEILGDPIPSLPPLREEHFVHGGQWVCLSHKGTLVGLADGSGAVIKASQSAQAGAAPMTSQGYLVGHDKMKQFVRVTGRQMDEIMERWGGDHVDNDAVFSSFFKVILDIPAHLKGHSAKVHLLSTMEESLDSQIRKQQLGSEHPELTGTIGLGKALLASVEEVKNAIDNGTITPNTEAMEALNAIDECATLWVSNIAPDHSGGSDILKEIACKLVLNRDCFSDMPEGQHGQIFKLVSALGADAPAVIQNQLVLLRDAFSDYIDRNTSIMPEKSLRV